MSAVLRDAPVCEAAANGYVDIVRLIWSHYGRSIKPRYHYLSSSTRSENTWCSLTSPYRTAEDWMSGALAHSQHEVIAYLLDQGVPCRCDQANKYLYSPRPDADFLIRLLKSSATPSSSLLRSFLSHHFHSFGTVGQVRGRFLGMGHHLRAVAKQGRSLARSPCSQVPRHAQSGHPLSPDSPAACWYAASASRRMCPNPLTCLIIDLLCQRLKAMKRSPSAPWSAVRRC